jgi:hypothetical protein
VRRNGIRVPVAATTGEILRGLSDELLERIAADLEADMPKPERERLHTWISGLSDDELKRLVEGA